MEQNDEPVRELTNIWDEAMSFASVNKLGEKTAVGKCLENIYKEKIKERIGGKEILKVFFSKTW